MQLEQETSRKRRKEHRFIDRPRLLRALDASQAQVRMLIAPAGFGKTTLADQWTRASASNVAWYPCQNASADVAALAAGIAAVAAGLIPGCDRRLRERIMVTANPAEEVDVLADILAEDISSWPPDAWLVIDDYQLICRTAEAELFVQLLVEGAPVNVLIAGRRRPSWVSSRDVLYGGVLELNQTELAMSREEAEFVLGEEAERPGVTSGLVSIANGWPAVIALAGVSGVPELPADDAPEALYDFFAAEVYRGLAEEDRAGLGLLSAATALDQSLANLLLGPTRAAHTIAEGVSSGVIVERGDRLEIHPLVRTFVEAKVVEEWPDEHASAVAACLEEYRVRRDWDAAFDLVERNELVSELEPLLAEALDELLETGRLTTVERWVKKSAAVEHFTPLSAIAKAEIYLREGQSFASQTLAEQAIRQLPEGEPLLVRALVVAGTSAHLGAREKDALDFFCRAERAAATDTEAREARWRQLMCLTELEDERASQLLFQLSADIAKDDPRELVRLASRRLGYELRVGRIESLEGALDALQIVDLVKDSFVRTSFRATLAATLVLTGEYERAYQIAEALIADAEAHRVDFALPYAFTAAAGAAAGLQGFADAELLVSRALETALSQGNLQARLNASATRLRIMLQQGRIDEVCAEALLPPAPMPSLQGELLGLRGLAVACSGRTSDACSISERAAQSSRAVETKVLVAAVAAIATLRNGDAHAGEVLEALLDTAVATQAIDLLVTAYRACPDLLGVMLRAPATRDEAWAIVKKGRDDRLARLVGVPVPAQHDVRALLSPREREIYDLVCQGLSTQQIAKMLFISTATVKVHVQKVFDKTGIRSRTALAVNAARAQLRQATSAMAADRDFLSESAT